MSSTLITIKVHLEKEDKELLKEDKRNNGRTQLFHMDKAIREYCEKLRTQKTK